MHIVFECIYGKIAWSMIGNKYFEHIWSRPSIFLKCKINFVFQKKKFRWHSWPNLTILTPCRHCSIDRGCILDCIQSPNMPWKIHLERWRRCFWTKIFDCIYVQSINARVSSRAVIKFHFICSFSIFGLWWIGSSSFFLLRCSYLMFIGNKWMSRFWNNFLECLQFSLKSMIINSIRRRIKLSFDLGFDINKTVFPLVLIKFLPNFQQKKNFELSSFNFIRLKWVQIWDWKRKKIFKWNCCPICRFLKLLLSFLLPFIAIGQKHSFSSTCKNQDKLVRLPLTCKKSTKDLNNLFRPKGPSNCDQYFN